MICCRQCSNSLPAASLSDSDFPDAFSGNKFIYRTVLRAVILLEDHSGSCKITVDFPVSDHQISSSFVFDEAFHIIRRISKENPYLMRKSHPLLCEISDARTQAAEHPVKVHIVISVFSEQASDLGTVQVSLQLSGAVKEDKAFPLQAGQPVVFDSRIPEQFCKFPIQNLFQRYDTLYFQSFQKGSALEHYLECQAQSPVAVF